jgi:hypothetical protein
MAHNSFDKGFTVLECFRKIIFQAFVLCLLFLPGCSYQQLKERVRNNLPGGLQESPVQRLSEQDLNKMSKDEILKMLRSANSLAPESKKKVIAFDDSLSFPVLNKTGKTVYVAAFSYIKKKVNARWRWDKTPVYKLDPGESRLILIDYVPQKRDRAHAYGYLSIFEKEKDAEIASLQLLDDKHFIDLDRLARLKNETVVLEIEKYGHHEESWEYHTQNGHRETENRELDFMVENKSGKDLLVACFIYEQKEGSHDYDTWKYTKTPVILVKHGQSAEIDVRSIQDKYIWQYMRGVLAVFDLDQMDEAEKANFQLADYKKKLKLGRLSKLKGKKVVLDIEKYGVRGNFIDFTVKPLSFVLTKTKAF